MTITLPTERVIDAWRRAHGYIPPSWSGCDLAKRDGVRIAVVAGLRDNPSVRFVRSKRGVELRVQDGRHRLRALIEAGATEIALDVVGGLELIGD